LRLRELAATGLDALRKLGQEVFDGRVISEPFQFLKLYASNEFVKSAEDTLLVVTSELDTPLTTQTEGLMDPF
jgi:hypothetical protein